MNEKYIIVDSLDDLTKNYIGEGKTGICYKIDNKVFKLFKAIPRFPGMVKALSELHSENFSFPDKFVYLNEYDIKFLKGYLMNYMAGVKVSNIDEMTNMKELCLALDDLEKEIRNLTEEYGLLIKDLHRDNMLFTKDKKFKVLDTDLSVLNPYDEPIYNYRGNMQELGNCVLPLFMGYNSFKNEKIEYLYDLCTLEAKAKPSRVLLETKDILENETKEEIVTLHDFKESIKLIRK